MVADRYLRTGTDIPMIYHGTLAMLDAALRDAQRASRRVPGQHSLIWARGQQRHVIYVYENGALAWVSTTAHEE